MHKKILIKRMTIDNQPVRLELKATPVSIKAVEGDDTGIIEAYVSVFGNVDSYGDIVVKGAFKQAVEEFNADGRFPKGVWHHDWMQPIAKTLEMREDERGLYIKGQLILEVPKAAEVYALIKAGVLTDFSFGYSVRDYEYDSNRGIRYIKDIEIYEWSPVLVGANDMATLIGVKSAGTEISEVDKTEIIPEAVETPEATPTTPDPNHPVPAPVETEPAAPAAPEVPSTPEATDDDTKSGDETVETPSPDGSDGAAAAATEAPTDESQKSKTAEAEAKAGRVLSKENEQKVRDAMDALDEVVAKAKSTRKMFEELLNSLEQPTDDGKSSGGQSARSVAADPNLIKGLKIAAKQAIKGGNAMIVHIKKIEGSKIK